MTKWTTGKIKRLQESYRCLPNRKIAAELGFSIRAVQTMAKRIGLRKLGPEQPPAPPNEIQRLNYRIEELEALLGVNLKLPNEFGLSAMEMKFLGVLVRREIVNRDGLHCAIYGGRPECEQPALKTVEVHICNIRRKILPMGYAIRTTYNGGYHLDAESRDALKQLCAA